MSTILAIDAAWTANQPSGVALVKGNAEGWECVAATPSYESFIQFSHGIPVNWNQPGFPGHVPDVDALIDAAQRLAQSDVDLIAVDIPVSLVAIAARRPADDAISREFGARWCAAHTPSANRPGALGAALSFALNGAGFPLRTRMPLNVGARSLIEVYPHPALLSLMAAPQRVPYKVSKSTRYWPGTNVGQRIVSLLDQFHAIYLALSDSFGPLPFDLPPVENVARLALLKRYEDALDALVCAWVSKEYLRGNTVPLGDANASIWCPSNVVLGQHDFQ